VRKNRLIWRKAFHVKLFIWECAHSGPKRNLQIRVSWLDGNFWTIIKMSAEIAPYHWLTISVIVINAGSVLSWAFNYGEKQTHRIYAIKHFPQYLIMIIERRMNVILFVLLNNYKLWYYDTYINSVILVSNKITCNTRHVKLCHFISIIEVFLKFNSKSHCIRDMSIFSRTTTY